MNWLQRFRAWRIKRRLLRHYRWLKANRVYTKPDPATGRFPDWRQGDRRC